ncbi:MAG: type IX secretion system sortase PorU [Bacteroidetes bacterium]|nr:type IX secretion system sortase PorU [Bacteroidota bacterium]
MRKNIRLFVILILGFSLGNLTLSGLSQNSSDSYNYALNWNPIRITNSPGDAAMGLLSFKSSVVRQESGLLPVFLKSFPIDPVHDSVASLEIQNPVYQPLKDSDAKIVKGLENLPFTISPFHQISVSRKTSRLEVGLLPLRRNQNTGAIERLISFDLQIRLTRLKAPALKSATVYKENSILATGVWYKFATAVSGIFRLTYNDLKSAGIDPAAINPQNIRIYGNGGGMLPEANAATRIDDLMENAIFVAGEDDGRFDAGDYILFYGQCPDQWVYSNTEKIFHHRKNVYSDRMYYFLNFDIGSGKRITGKSSTAKPSLYTADRFDDYSFYEKDEVNLIKSGRQWWDRQYFDLTTVRDFSFNFPDIDNSTPVTLLTHVAARSTVGSTSFTVSAQGNTISTIYIPSVSGNFESNFANEETGSATFLPAGSAINVKLTYNKSSTSSVGYLNYLEMNATRLLKMNGNIMLFRSASGVTPGGVTEFNLTTGGQSLKIWDVTNGGNITEIITTPGDNKLVFRLETDTLREFVAFDGQAFYTPEFTGLVENQNLHGTASPDYLIVCHPSFLQEAERLSAFHEKFSNLSVLIITPEKIYNEFSSGTQDVTAIRDFVRMMYDKAPQGKEPKYLLLFGDASYDYKSRTQNNTNFVPSYESTESLSPLGSFVSDDYFGLLSADEGQSANGSLDIGIGRFPVFTVDQARQSVDKVIHYCSNSDTVKNDWRNMVTFVADDQNDGGNLFIEDSEDLARIIEQSYKDYNVDKIYSDAYTMLSTPGGARYPEVNDAINKRVEKGSLIVNYVGHGGELGWAHERILEVPDIKKWSNFSKMPVFVTATCEFSRFDDPERVSAGEWVFLNPQGGGSALFTTTRLTFAGPNKSLLENFYANVFKKHNGQYMKMGDLLVAAKEGMGSSANIHAFILLGDPAMQMAYPDLHVVTTSITSTNSTAVPDTLKALSEITISGEVQYLSGQIETNFSGTVFPTVFDKASEIWTKANQNNGDPVQFFLQKNPVYKGKADVVNGTFSFTFIVPKDIAYQYGPGKISYYARSAETDANGYSNILVGGYNNSAPVDDQGPELALYINNRNFRSGGITNQNPVLLADVSDTSGVNTVGNGIGHDITAILDNKTTIPIILNDYYVSDLNTFKSGAISYPLSSLADGTHSLTVKVWDVYNNSTSATIEFVVVSSGEFAFQNLYNYPNPMTDYTTFSWETNQVNQPQEVEIKIFTLTGELIKTLRENFYSQGFRAASITWDGSRDSGGKISSGMYVYRMRLMLTDGSTSYRSSKLVVIR